jgi:hypothetical protein
MSPVVVDSCVVVKWFSEVLSTEAVRIRDSGRPLHGRACSTWRLRTSPGRKFAAG